MTVPINSCNSVQQHDLVDSWPTLMDNTIFSCICCSLRFFSKNLPAHKHSSIDVDTIYYKPCLSVEFNKLSLPQRMLSIWSLQTCTVLLLQFTSLSLFILSQHLRMESLSDMERKEKLDAYSAVVLLPTLPTKTAGCYANNLRSFNTATKTSFWVQYSSWFVSHSYSSLTWNNSKFPGNLDTCPQMFLCQ